MHPADNVTAIVANEGGLAEGTLLPEWVVVAGLLLADAVPQGHKLTLCDIARGEPVRRYNVTIERVLHPIAAGS